MFLDASSAISSIMIKYAEKFISFAICMKSQTIQKQGTRLYYTQIVCCAFLEKF